MSRVAENVPINFIGIILHADERLEHVKTIAPLGSESE